MLLKKNIINILTFFIILFFTFSTKADNLIDSTNFLSDIEFKQKNTDAVPININCNKENSLFSSQDWLKSVKKINLYIDVDKYYRSIIKKTKLPSLVNNLDDPSRSWASYRKGKIKFHNSNCKYKIKYRLTGDLSDHIGLNGGLPHSVKIILKDSNVGNIVKFKLLRPNTRNGKYEIFNVLIHKKFGFFAPRSALVQVQIGGETHNVLFQEDITKEFLEHNKIHEAILIEGEEGYSPFVNPKIINTKMNNNIYFKKISKDIMEILGKVYLMTSLSDVVGVKKKMLIGVDQGHITDSPININFLPEKDKPVFQLFNLLNLSLKSSKGLTADDTRITYDHISRKLYPIYYDGHHGEGYSKANFYFSEDQRKHIISKFKELDIENLSNELQKYGADFSKTEVSKKINESIEILKKLKSSNNKNLIKQDDIKSYFKKGIIRFADLYNQKTINFSWIQPENKIKKCKVSTNELKCKVVNIDNDFEYPLEKQNPRKNIFIHGLNKDYPEKNYSKNISKNTVEIGNEGTSIEFTQDLNLDINKEKKIISIKSSKNTFGDKQVRVFGGSLEGWKFIASKDTNLSYKKEINTRASKFGLTGCITFNDIKLIDISFKITNSNCEDGIHFIRAHGNIKELSIKDSASDAIDADFSNLLFSDINVINSGNDCIDLSGGKYLIQNLITTGCKDKAVSAGENSIVIIDKIISKDTSIGLVSKDGSKLTVKQAKISDSKICMASYQKKKEFGGGTIYFKSDNINCNNIPSYIHASSNIIRFD